MDNFCIFKTGIPPAGGASQFQAVAGADSAIGVLPDPPPTSRCNSLGTGMIQLVAAKTFSLQCGQIFAGNDIEQQFQSSFAGCLDACAAAPACGGVSFDANQSQGFKNCYLKTRVSTGGLLARAGVDSAFAVTNNAAVVTSPSTTFLPASSTHSSSASSSSSSGQSAFPAQSTVLSSGLGLLAETTSSTSVPGAGITTPPAAEEVGSPSNAWIAAPVIGSLAAVALVLGLVALLSRRNRGRHFPIRFLARWRERYLPRPQTSSSNGGKITDEEATRAGSAMSSRGLASATTGGSRNSILVTGIVSKDIEVLAEGDGKSRAGDDDPTSGLGLELDEIVGRRGASGPRDSQNGLKLNGLSIRSTAEEIVPGIPLEFAGPDHQGLKRDDAAETNFGR